MPHNSNDKILKHFDEGLMTDMAMIDLQKPFDTIDHAIPLRKTGAIGFSNHNVDSNHTC